MVCGMVISFFFFFSFFLTCCRLSREDDLKFDSIEFDNLVINRGECVYGGDADELRRNFPGMKDERGCVMVRQWSTFQLGSVAGN